MEVDCEGCAGCCVDWRPLADGDLDAGRRGRYRPLDDVYRFAVCSRDDVLALLDAGYGDALTARLFAAEEGPEVDGHTLAAVGDRPAFLVGLRKVPKPVAPLDADPAWLPACAFLDPETLQCRVHGDDVYPAECASFPGHELALGVETECERVERETDGQRLLDADPPADLEPVRFDPGALGTKVFCYPDADALSGTVARAAAGQLTAADRAELVAAAVASAPGSGTVDCDRVATARERVLAADSWVGRAADDWASRAGEDPPDPGLGAAVAAQRGAPSTPGWPLED